MASETSDVHHPTTIKTEQMKAVVEEKRAARQAKQEAEAREGEERSARAAAMRERLEPVLLERDETLQIGKRQQQERSVLARMACKESQVTLLTLQY
jgi:hypothetical protein